MANPAPTARLQPRPTPLRPLCETYEAHMANYVATTAILQLLLMHSKCSGTNTFTPKKSTNKAPGDFQRARTALTPEQESAEISRFLAIVEQERAQDTKTRVTYACKPSNEAGSTEMGRSHSISNANGATNDIEAAEPKNDNDDDARNNTPPTSLPRQEDSPLASYERPIKKQRVRFDNTITIIKNKDNNEVAKCDSFKIPAFNAEDLSNDKRGTIRTVSESASNASSPIAIRRLLVEKSSKPRSPSSYFKKTHVSLPCSRRRSPENSDDAILPATKELSNKTSLTLIRQKLAENETKQ
ncbi:hypothetical protein MHU86_20352 [Fragilaria crotonensis]|nr:hypothetical protein MHU86_20352 [Fragilaria crotonensis]